MSQTGRYHGGLVIAGTQDSALDRFSRIVSATLEDYGHNVERQSVMNTRQARITASRYLVKLNLAPVGNSDAKKPLQRLELALCSIDPAQSDQTHSELLLVVMMYRMVDAYTAEHVEWLDPETVLSTEEFLGAFSSVSPRRVRGRQQILDERSSRFASVDDTAPNLAMQYDVISGQKPFAGFEGPVSLSEEQALSLAFRIDAHPDEVDSQELADMPDSDVRRLATWGMTGMLVFVSAPVAISMAAVNLVRGEDFRLNTHVLSLSGLLVVLETSGALAHAVSILPI